MPRHPWPIPHKIDLGFHIINVELLGRRQMREAMDDDDPQEGRGEIIEGFWDIETDTIAIGKWLPRRVQRWVLVHELVHACIDLRDRYDKEP
jgi:Zn-dependent peptidase ImmA (M78 family)